MKIITCGLVSSFLGWCTFCNIIAKHIVFAEYSCQDTLNGHFTASTKVQLKRVHSWIVWKAQEKDDTPFLELNFNEGIKLSLHCKTESLGYIRERGLFWGTYLSKKGPKFRLSYPFSKRFRGIYRPICGGRVHK